MPTRFDWRAIRRLGLTLGATVLLLTGCNAAEKPQAATPASVAPPAQPAVMPAVSVNALMVAWMDNSAHVLWNVEKPGRAPKNDADWLDIQEHATQLAAAGTLIQLGGTGQADPGWVKTPDWKTHSQTLTNAALDAIKAAKAKDQAALVKANGQLVESCESCHKEFKPELPSEGISHHPPHER